MQVIDVQGLVMDDVTEEQATAFWESLATLKHLGEFRLYMDLDIENHFLGFFFKSVSRLTQIR